MPRHAESYMLRCYDPNHVSTLSANLSHVHCEHCVQIRLVVSHMVRTHLPNISMLALSLCPASLLMLAVRSKSLWDAALMCHLRWIFLVLTVTIETKLLLLPWARSGCSSNCFYWVDSVCFVHSVCSLSAPSVCLRILIQTSLSVMAGMVQFLSVCCVFASLLRTVCYSRGQGEFVIFLKVWYTHGSFTGPQQSLVAGHQIPPEIPPEVFSSLSLTLFFMYTVKSLLCATHEQWMRPQLCHFMIHY